LITLTSIHPEKINWKHKVAMVQAHKIGERRRRWFRSQGTKITREIMGHNLGGQEGDWGPSDFLQEDGKA